MKKIIKDENDIVLKILPTSAKANGVNIFNDNDNIFNAIKNIEKFIDKHGNKKLKFANGVFSEINPELTAGQEKIEREMAIEAEIRKKYTLRAEILALVKGAADNTDAEFVQYKVDVDAAIALVDS